VYKDMEQWTSIRHRILREGVSRREIQRETGMHWETVKKILDHPSPPPFKRSPRAKPKIGPYLDEIKSIIESDKALPKKQRHTAKRIFEVIKENGYQGGYTAVKDAVREIKKHSREVFVPLRHDPGEAQMDFGEALIKMDGVLRKTHFFVMVLPHSDAFFVKAYERENTETFQDGHAEAFKFFGGVPRRITYDNSRISISNILGARDRKYTDGFLQLQSHYLFSHHFCLVRRANEKGVVEGVVKYARQNFFVPVPQVRDLSELNSYLRKRCLSDMDRKLRGKSATKAELRKEDQAAFFSLPVTAFDACRKASCSANSLSLVRFDKNDYSVPVRYAHHAVVVKGYEAEVRIFKDDRLIAEHKRIWDKERVSFDPIHYLALLEKKPGAFDYARPLEDLKLPECFLILRKRQEHEMQDKGVLEFIRVLRLLEKHSLGRLAYAVERGLRIHAHTRDAIAQFLYPDEPWFPPLFCLDGHEHLKGVKVASPDLSSYRCLMGGAVNE
jgi:transposase